MTKAKRQTQSRVENSTATNETNGTSGLMEILPAVGISISRRPFTDGKEQEENHESAEDRAGSPVALWLPNIDGHDQSVHSPDTKIPAESSRVGHIKLRDES